MFKLIWDKLTDILGDKIGYIILGIVLCSYGIYHINQYYMTNTSFANEKDKIEDKIEDVKADSDEKDLLIEYKVLEMELSSVEQQQWALEDRIEEEAVEPTLSQQSRQYKMEKRVDEIKQRKMEIQKELMK